jgi:hypothetical protein
VGGQVVSFMKDHLGLPVPFPAVPPADGQRLRREAHSFAEANEIPVVHFKKGIAASTSCVLTWTPPRSLEWLPSGWPRSSSGVFTGYERPTDKAGAGQLRLRLGRRRVSCFFYVNDAEFGPAFVKICSYFFPNPAKVWFNGHEWAKRQAAKEDLGFTELANAFATCEDPARPAGHLRPCRSQSHAGLLRALVGSQPHPAQFHRLPGGYWGELSMRQVKLSRTIVFDAPRRGRAFFEATVGRQLGPGTPRRGSSSSSDARSERPPRAPSPPRSSPEAPRWPSTCSTRTRGSRST